MMTGCLLSYHDTAKNRLLKLWDPGLNHVENHKISLGSNKCHIVSHGICYIFQYINHISWLFHHAKSLFFKEIAGCLYHLPFRKNTTIHHACATSHRGCKAKGITRPGEIAGFQRSWFIWLGTWITNDNHEIIIMILIILIMIVVIMINNDKQ